MPQYIGIDVSKNKLDLAWLKDVQSQKFKTKTFSNNPADYHQIIDWLNSNHINLTDIHLVVEATGVYHENIAYYLHNQDIKVSIINPAFSKSYADSLGSRNKTDKKDSMILARYAQSANPEAWTPPPQEARQLKSLLARLDALEKDLQREKNRQEKALATDTAIIVKQSIDKMIEAIQSAINQLNKDIDDHIDNHPSLKHDQQLLQSISGVGTVVSRQMVSLFHNKSFKSASQVSAFLGLVPKQHESGLFKGKSRLAKNGSAQVRAKLYMATVTATRFNPDIKHQYERLQANGKCKMQALCASMRKLVHICFGVFKHQSPYRSNLSLCA